MIWRLQVNKILQDLESYGGSIHETKGPSQRKMHVCLRCREMQPLVSPNQESVSWRDHDVVFSRTFFQLIQEQISHQSVREIDSTTTADKNSRGRPMEFSCCWVWTTAWYPYKILRIKPYSSLSLSIFILYLFPPNRISIT